jgi:hypothetical protein
VRKIVFLALLAAGGLAMSSAHADFWKDVNPLRELTPNWGPLIPQPKSINELNPTCVGAPQDCRALGKKERKTHTFPQIKASKNLYVARRYYCHSTSTHQEVGTCDVTSRFANSCEEAQAAIQSHVDEIGGDPCKQCADVRDNTKYWSGRAENIQGGPCTGL